MYEETVQDTTTWRPAASGVLVEGLGKRFGDTEALADLNHRQDTERVQVEENTIYLLIDATAPTIAGLPVDCTLWPPNHKMVDAATIAGSESGSGLSSFSVVASSSEASTGDVAVSGTGLAPRRVSLRAERSGEGTGRVYTVTATAADRAGNVTTASGTCSVPLSQGS